MSRECVHQSGVHCALLVSGRCTLEGCRFAVSENDLLRARAKTFARLSAMPPEQQNQISEQYYGGRMPWNEVAGIGV